MIQQLSIGKLKNNVMFASIHISPEAYSFKWQLSNEIIQTSFQLHLM